MFSFDCLNAAAAGCTPGTKGIRNNYDIYLAKLSDFTSGYYAYAPWHLAEDFILQGIGCLGFCCSYAFQLHCSRFE